MNAHYEAVLADLEQMKADAEDGIRAIKRLLSRSGESAPTAVPVSSRSILSSPRTKGDEQSLPTLILHLLSAQPSRSFRAEDIAEGIGTTVNMKTLRGALSRMARHGRIAKHGRGRYRAPRAKTHGSGDADASAAAA